MKKQKEHEETCTHTHTLSTERGGAGVYPGSPEVSASRRMVDTHTSMKPHTDK